MAREVRFFRETVYRACIVVAFEGCPGPGEGLTSASTFPELAMTEVRPRSAPAMRLGLGMLVLMLGLGSAWGAARKRLRAGGGPAPSHSEPNTRPVAQKGMVPKRATPTGVLGEVA